MVAADLLFIRNKKQNRQQRGFRECFNPSFLSTTPSSLSPSQFHLFRSNGITLVFLLLSVLGKPNTKYQEYCWKMYIFHIDTISNSFLIKYFLIVLHPIFDADNVLCHNLVILFKIVNLTYAVILYIYTSILHRHSLCPQQTHINVLTSNPMLTTPDNLLLHNSSMYSINSKSQHWTLKHSCAKNQILPMPLELLHLHSSTKLVVEEWRQYYLQNHNMQIFTGLLVMWWMRCYQYELHANKHRTSFKYSRHL